MAKLYFYYSAMNAGKTTTLIQAAYNYRERGMHPYVLKPSVDDRGDPHRVVSRIGLDADATTFGPEDDLESLCRLRQDQGPLDCVFVDEAQFLTREQVRQLARVVDRLGAPVLCYGLRTDFRGEVFEGSGQLLAWSDEVVEIKTLCHCGAKATMSLRLDPEGRVMRGGEQIQIGGNERYLSVCRKHAREKLDAED